MLDLIMYAFCFGKFKTLDLSNVKVLKTRAFYVNDPLESVEAQNVEVVGNYAFSKCVNIRTIDMPVCGSVGVQAFYSDTASSLTDVRMPVCTSIGEGAFNGCKSLVVGYFPSLTNIGKDAFIKTGKIKLIVVGEVDTLGGAIFDQANTTTRKNKINVFVNYDGPIDPSYTWQSGTTKETNGCTVWYMSAEAASTSMLNGRAVQETKIINLGEGKGADSVYLNTGINVMDATSADLAAANCFVNFYGDGVKFIAPINYLPEVGTSFEIPASVQIGEDTLDVVCIGERAFKFSPKYTHVTCPDSVTEVGREAFYYVTLQGRIDLLNVETMGASVFYGSTLKELYAPKVTTIGNQSFSGCDYLEKCIMPRLTTMGDYDFYQVHRLQHLVIGPVDFSNLGATATHDQLFRNYNIGSLSRPRVLVINGTASGGAMASNHYFFKNAEHYEYGLALIEDHPENRSTYGTASKFNSRVAFLPQGVRGEDVKIYSANIGESNEKMPAFAYCITKEANGAEHGEITLLYYMRSVNMTMAMIDQDIAAIQQEGAIAEGLTYEVTAIGDMCFWHNKSNLLTGTLDTTLPQYSKVERIGAKAFAASNLDAVTIKNGVAIGNDAFSNSTIGGSLTIGDDSTGDITIGARAFQNNKIGTLTIGDVGEGNISIGEYAFASSTFGSLTFSDEIDGNIYLNGGYIFRYVDGFQSVTFPNNVVAVGSNLFAYSYITNVTFSEGCTMNLPDSMFYYCRNLVAVDFPNTGCMTVGDSVFCYCALLRQIEFKSVVSIGNNCFKLSGIIKVTSTHETTTPSGDVVRLSSVGDSAFEETPLIYVDMPFVDNVGGGIFYKSASLVFVRLGLINRSIFTSGMSGSSKGTGVFIFDDRNEVELGSNVGLGGSQYANCSVGIYRHGDMNYTSFSTGGVTGLELPYVDGGRRISTSEIIFYKTFTRNGIEIPKYLFVPDPTENGRMILLYCNARTICVDQILQDMRDFEETIVNGALGRISQIGEYCFFNTEITATEHIGGGLDLSGFNRLVKIGASAFASNSNRPHNLGIVRLDKANPNFDDPISTIGAQAFKGVTAESITLRNNRVYGTGESAVYGVTIGTNAFEGISVSGDVSLLGNTDTISANAFRLARIVGTLYLNNVRSIPDNAGMINSANIGILDIGTISYAGIYAMQNATIGQLNMGNIETCSTYLLRSCNIGSVNTEQTQFPVVAGAGAGSYMFYQSTIGSFTTGETTALPYRMFWEGNVGNLVIGKNVQTIDAQAFYNMSSCRIVTIEKFLNFDASGYKETNLVNGFTADTELFVSSIIYNDHFLNGWGKIPRENVNTYDKFTTVGDYSYYFSETEDELFAHPASVTLITYNGNQSVTTLHIPNRLQCAGETTSYVVTSIESTAFLMLTQNEWSVGITEIVFPHYLQSIDYDYAMMLPSVEQFALASSSGAKIEHTGANPTAAAYRLQETDGVLYMDSILILYPIAKTDVQFEVGSSINAIGRNAFAGNPYIERVIAHRTSVSQGISMYGGAFDGCTSFERMEISIS